MTIGLEFEKYLLIGLVVVLIATIPLARWVYVRGKRIRRQLGMFTYFSNISHELINPLTILTASVEHLRNTVPEEEHEYNLMSLNIQRAVRLLQQINDAIRSQEGSLQLVAVNTDVIRVVADTARCIEPLANSKRISLTVGYNPESMMGWVDADKLDKIVFNLLVHAVQQAPEGGRVSLDVSTNSLFDHIILRISDNGEGIPKEKLRDIFSHVHYIESRATQFFGDGLGLALTHDLVSIHHGNISFKTIAGQGTTFYVDLPIGKEAFKVSEIDESSMLSLSSSGTSIQALSQMNVNDLQRRIDDFVANVQRIRSTMIANQEEEPDESSIAQRLTLDEEFLKKATDCVLAHISDSDYDRDTFAADMGASASTLYNKLRAITGKNVTAFIRELRIKEACRLAESNPDLRVSDIAYQVGFKDPKYFATSFKKEKGIQPKEYFNQLRASNVS